MNETTECGDSENALEYEFLLLRINERIMCGELEEAETLLRETRKKFMTPAVLDLAARTAVLKGQFKQAGQYWRAVLDLEPENVCAKQALSCLSGPWFAYAVLKRIAMLACIALGIVMVSIGLLSVIYAAVPFHVRDAQNRKLVKPIVSSSREHHAKTATPAAPAVQEKMASAKEAIPVKPLPVFTMEGAVVTPDGRGMKIVFNEGLFSYRDVLSDSATESLYELGRIVKAHVPVFSIMVEGHADSDSMPPGGVFKNNYELGLYRAAAAVRILVDSGLPENSVAACSMGDKNPPFPNDCRENKQKNRTVVVRLLPNESGKKEK